jgi:hypothetical protein
MAELTQERLKQVLRYEPETGLFYWVEHKMNRKIGWFGGATNRDGYLQIMINKRCYGAHRLAWLYVHGVWPDKDIDHINGVRDDNRIENIRLASKSENQQNRTSNKNNKSGISGVSWHKAAKKWRAYICVNYKIKHLGLFEEFDKAKECYLAAKAELHKFQPIPRELMKEEG